MFPRFAVPRSLTKDEELQLLRTVRDQGSVRDSALLHLALGTGLRLRELAHLNVGDVGSENGIAWKVVLDPRWTARFLRWKKRAVEPLDAHSPLFFSRQRRRVGLRGIQFMFRKWQAAAGFAEFYPFHALRHTAITNVYRATKDLYLTQRFARHSSPLTTTVYTHPSDEELYAAIRGLKS